jgi:hypothetical protein
LGTIESADSTSSRRLRIFISYRREDASDAAGRLYDRLEAEFADSVFMDVDNIPPGADFVEAIDRAVGDCDVLIAVIGKKWLSARDAARRQRRLDIPEDFVRLELEAALRRPNILIAPFVLEGAQMPRSDQLPESLRPLVRRNAVFVTHTNWASDVASLIRALKREAERLAREETEREAAEVAERERAERQAAEVAERERAEREAEVAEREAEVAERERAEREAEVAEVAERERAEREAEVAEVAERERAERQAAEVAERERAERQAAEVAERERAEREVAEVPEVAAAERFPSRTLRVTVATMALVGSVFILGGTLTPVTDHLEFPHGFATHPLLFPDHVAAFIFALVCGVLLLTRLRRQSLRIAGFLAGVGAQQAGAQLGIFLGLTAHVGGDPDFGWGAFTSLIGAAILLSASTVSFYRLRKFGPPAGVLPRVGPSARAAAGLGAVLFVIAGFINDEVNDKVSAGFAVPLAVVAIAAAVFVFRPPRDQAWRVFVWSALLSFGALLAIGYVFAALSVSYYFGEIDAASMGFRAVSGILLLGAAVVGSMGTARKGVVDAPRR